MCLAVEMCRGPDGIRCSDNLRNIWEGIRSSVSTLAVDILFQLCTNLVFYIVGYEQGALDIRHV